MMKKPREIFALDALSLFLPLALRCLWHIWPASACAAGNPLASPGVLD